MDFIVKTISKPFLDLRTKLLPKILSPYLESGMSVLDIGSGDGMVAYKLSLLKKLRVEGVDVVIQPKTNIKTTKYDGARLPFPANSFDCVLLIDVLHHANNPEALLKEAARVSRKTILIKDHFWKSKFDFIKLQIGDYFGNHPYGVPLPYNYLKLSRWRQIFQNLSLTIVESTTGNIYVPFDISKHVIFKLRK